MYYKSFYVTFFYRYFRWKIAESYYSTTSQQFDLI